MKNILKALFAPSKLLLKQKIASLVIWFGMFSALIIGGLVFVFLDKNLIDSRQQEIVKNINKATLQSSLIFKSNQLLAEAFSRQSLVKEILVENSKFQKNELLNIFLEYINQDPKYLAIYLLDRDGKAVVSTDEKMIGQGQDSKNYFIKAINGSPAVEAVIEPSNQEFGYYFSYPVFDKSKTPIGVIVVKTNNNDINNYLFSGETEQGDLMMMTDEFGVVVASSRDDRLFRSLAPLSENTLNQSLVAENYHGKEIMPLQYDEVLRVINDYKGLTVIDFDDKKDGGAEKLSISKVPGLPFYLVIESKIGEITSQVLMTVLIIWALILGGLMVESSLIYYILSVFLRPLKRLRDISKHLGQGDFSRQIKVETDDEFGELAQAFKGMSERLKDLYKNLDEKVRMKTKDVDKKAKQLIEQKKAIANILEDVELEKKRAESLTKDLDKFKLAVEGASDQIIITNSDGVIIFANSALEKTTGFKPEEVIGEKAGSKDLWGGEMGEEFYKKMWKTIKIDKKVFFGEVNNHRKNGEKYTSSASISPILDENGEVLFFVAIERDITREKMIDKAKSEFVSLASHQLRTPLSAIKWTLEMFKQDKGLDVKHQERINDIYESNERLISLVNNLLNVSHIEDGKVVAKKQTVELDKLIENNLKDLKVNADKRKQVLNLEIDAKISPVQIDVLKFNEAFNNLVSNAINYSPEGLEIDVKLQAIGNNYVIAVHNDLPIISTIDQEKLFTKFYRGTNAQTVNTTGSGLGLFIAKAAVEENGGKIWFESKEGLGTTFFFTVPKKGGSINKTATKQAEIKQNS